MSVNHKITHRLIELSFFHIEKAPTIKMKNKICLEIPALNEIRNITIEMKLKILLPNNYCQIINITIFLRFLAQTDSSTALLTT